VTFFESNHTAKSHEKMPNHTGGGNGTISWNYTWGDVDLNSTKIVFLRDKKKYLDKMFRMTCLIEGVFY
jgi:hypothetical protein